MIAALILAIVGAAAPESPPEVVTIECDGAVEWRSSSDGASGLALSGGVRVTRGTMVLRSRTAEVQFDRNPDAPRGVTLAGGVVVESRRFGARSGTAQLARREDAGGLPAVPARYDLRLSRGADPWVELRADDLVVTCAGDLTYDARARTAVLSGGVRGAGPTMALEATEARIVFAPDVAPVEPAPAADATPAPTPARIERIELTGAVEVRTKPADSSATRRVLAPRAVYVAADDLVTFSGPPDPRLISVGVVVSAPELRLFLAENRIESSTGKMKAVIGPPGGEQQ